MKRSKNHPKEKWVSVFSQPPSAFIKRRLHSVAGLFLTFFLVEHLFVNSQSALFWGESGRGFIRAANAIHDLPYLTIIELVFLLVPFLIHGYLGVVYLLEMAPTSFATAGNAPSLPQYPRNRAYTWQRITATLLVVGILAHVIHMRFVHYPDNVGADRYQMEAPHCNCKVWRQLLTSLTVLKVKVSCCPTQILAQQNSLLSEKVF